MSATTSVRTRTSPLTVIGWVLAALGVIVLAGAAVLQFIVGVGGEVRSGVHRVETATRALVVPLEGVSGLGDLRDLDGSGWGRPPRFELAVTAADPARPVFAGIGTAAAVDAYLAGAAVETVDDLSVDPWSLATTPRSGTGVPAAPTTQTIWTASGESGGSGTAVVSWPLEDGDWRLVVMNADASPVVAADGSVGIALPGLEPVARITFWTGLVLAVLGGGMVLAVALSRRQRPVGPVEER